MRTERGSNCHLGFSTISFRSNRLKTNVILFRNVLLEALPLPAANYIIPKLGEKTTWTKIKSAQSLNDFEKTII